MVDAKPLQRAFQFGAQVGFGPVVDAAGGPSTMPALVAMWGRWRRVASHLPITVSHRPLP
jgi:hypothetical protein